MPRTKQSASRSTGAPCVRVTLHPSAIKQNAKPIAQPIGIRVSPRLCCRFDWADQGTQTGDRAPNDEVRLLNSIQYSTDFLQWCCSCGDGRHLLDCDSCERAVCSKCLDLSAGSELIKEPDVDFFCMGCHLGSKNRAEPFYVSTDLYQHIFIDTECWITASLPQRQAHQKCHWAYQAHDTKGQLRMAKHELVGHRQHSTVHDPNPRRSIHFSRQHLGRLVHQHIRKKNVIYQRGSLGYWCSESKIIGQASESSQGYHQKLSTVSPFYYDWTQLTAPNRFGVRRLVVFLFTHANPENGDLHCANNSGIQVESISSSIPLNGCLLM